MKRTFLRTSLAAVMLFLVGMMGSSISAQTVSTLAVGAQSPTWVMSTTTPALKATYAVTITKSSTGNEDFALTTGPLPAGVTAVFSPNPVNIKGGSGNQGTSTLTLTATAGTPQGSASFTVTCRGVNDSRQFRLDTVNPTGVLSTPAATTKVSGSVDLTATANDSASTVSSVDFYVDNIMRGSGTRISGTATSGTWKYSFDTSVLNGNSHNWHTVITDVAGNVLTNAARTIDVVPTVSLTSPAANALVGATTTLTATATGANAVEFYVNNALVGTDTNGADGWTHSLNTTTGNHTWYARAVDAGGDVATASARAFVADATSPAVTATSPTDGAVVRNTIALTATASDANLSKVEFYVDGAYKGDGTNNGGTFTYSFNTTGQTQGVHAWWAKAYDSVGNTAVSSSSFIVDTVAPIITSITPANNSYVRGAVTLTASVTELNMAQVDFRLGGVSRGIDTNGSDGWSITVNGLPNGQYQYIAVATDKAGNNGNSTQQTLTVDNAAPSVALSTPAANAPVSGTVILTATATDNASMKEVRFFVNGAQVGIDADSTGGWTYSYNTTGLTDGDHNWSATAYDQAGNSASTATRVMKVDNIAPTVNLQTPADNAVVSGPVTLTATASGNISVEFYVNGVLRATDTDGSDGWSYNLDTTGLTDGNRTWNARAIDAAGNSATTPTRTMRVDNTAPAVTLSSPAAAAVVGGTTALTASVTEANIDKVEFYFNGTLKGNGTNDAGTWTYNLDTTGVSDGNHNWSVKAIDLAGQTTSRTRALTVDNTRPVINSVSPIAGTVIGGTAVTLSADVTDANMDKVVFRVQGTVVGTDTDGSDGWSITFNATILVNGNAPYTATAHDLAGNNRASASVTLTVDNSAPTCVLSSPANNAVVNNTIELKAAAGDNNSVDRVRFFVNGDAVGTTTVGVASIYTVSFDASTLAQGTYTWFARAFDKAGNRTDSATRNLIVDKTPPAGVELQTPNNNAFVNGIQQIRLRNTLVEANMLRTDFYVDGIKVGDDPVASRYQYDFDTRTVGDGPHTFYAIAVDKAGNTTTSDTRTMRVDNTAPVVNLVAPANDVFASASIDLSATASDFYLDKVEFHVDGVLRGTGTNDAGTFTFSFDTTVLADGTYTWSATAYDLSGKSTTTGTRTIKVDNNAPVVTATSPADNSLVEGTITLSATASDTYLDRVDFYVGTTLIGTGTGNAGTWSIQLDTTTLTDGIHAWTAKAFDFSGKDATSGLNLDVFNNDAPTLDAIADPTPIAKNSGRQTINLTGITAGAPNESGQTLTIIAASGDTNIIPDPVASAIVDGSATLTYTPVADALGNAVITVTVNDGHATNNTVTRTFTVRVIPPNEAPVAIADIYNVNEDAVLTVEAPGVLGNDTDAEESALTAHLVNGTSNGTLTLNASGSFVYTPAPDFRGTDSFTYKANDGVLDSSPVDVTINIASVNDGPIISNIANATTAQEAATAALAFTVSDLETAAGDLTLTATSTNTALATADNIQFGGSDGNRTVTVTPITGQFGSTTITVTVHDADGGTATSDFVLTVIPRPVISTFNPPAAGYGQSVTISGNYFAGATSVTFNSIAAVFTVAANGSSITATVPASGVVTGKIRVTTPGGTGVSATDFSWVQAPQVGNPSPGFGAYNQEITLSGSHLLGTTSVRFGTTNYYARTTSVPAGITSVTVSQIKFKVPEGVPAGSYDLIVSTPGGLGTSASKLTVYPPPAIASFSPGSGPIGSTVNISGNNFNGTTLVRFNTQHTLAFTVNNNNSLSVAVPAGATNGKIQVVTRGGEAFSNTNFTVVLAPVIGSFSPASGSPGTIVNISGNNLSGVTNLFFNGVSATFEKISAFSIKATVPVGATTGKISARNGNVTPNLTGISSTDFVVTQGPTITSLSPASGQVGTGVVITGTNFSNVSSVKFNGMTAGYVVNSATQITTTVPLGATTGKVSVTTNSGTGLSNENFTVNAGTAAPVITSFSPGSGATGTTVFINGTGFSGATSIKFAGITGGWTVLSPLRAQATVPLNAVTGKISITTLGGTAESLTDFTVTKQPVIFSFTPDEGVAGMQVTINGANFSGSSAVKFNGVNAGFTILSATQIRATVPNAATTGKISITNGVGTGLSSTDFKVTPRVDSFTPASGPVGTVVTITGRAFTGATAVQFGGELAEFTVVSSTQITAIVPVDAVDGPITVNTPSGVGNSAAIFDVTP